MSEQRPQLDERWERLVREAARGFSYPPTPDISAMARQRIKVKHPSPYRRLAGATAVVLLVLGGLLAVPEVRAAVLEILRIGGITIFLNEPTATPTATPEPTVTGVVRTPRPTITPFIEPTPIASVLDLPGETTLEAARDQTSFDIPLPTYPDGLGAPDHIFLQDLGGAVVTLVWLDDDGNVRLSLQMLNERIVGSKYEPNNYTHTTVHDQAAMWLTGAHILAFYEPGGGDLIRRIESNVLIWEQDGITFRLETDTSIEEAVRTAESLQ
jgi:hypothetical protein